MGRKSPACLAVGEDAGEGEEHGLHEGEGFGVEARGALGDLAEHEGREPGAVVGHLDHAGDEGGEALVGGDGAVGDLGDEEAEGPEHVADDLAVEGELVGEVVVDHRLVEAGGVGDVVDADAVEAAGGEELGGGKEDVFARVAEGGAAGSGTGCGHESN